ncbi:MAG TPA: hypothetical protein VJT14_01565 [Candidatus Dormibacteraeota bacterium]|nr:hypothetical protein [Candidatus Dormibacteraeota bacterium]
MRLRTLLPFVLTVSLGVATCQGPTPSQSPAAIRPGARAVTLVLFEGTGEFKPVTIRFLTEAGRESGHLTFPPATLVWAAGAGRVFIETSDHVLKVLDRDGATEVLDPHGSSVVVARGGARWAWMSSSSDQGFDTLIKVASDGVAPRVVYRHDNLHPPGQPFAPPLPLAWTATGIYVSTIPKFSIGYWPFASYSSNAGNPLNIGTMFVVNPATGESTALPLQHDCMVMDVSDSGVIACWPLGPPNALNTNPTLRLVFPGGRVTNLRLPTPRFNGIGDAFFSPDGAQLTVAGATLVAINLSGRPHKPQPEEYGVDLVRVSDMSIRPFGPFGTRVAMGEESWLPDGNLVLWRPSGAAGGGPGLYVVDPSGSGKGRLIPTSAYPIGYLW